MASQAGLYPRAGYCFLGLFGLSVLAFWPLYFARLPGGPELLAHLHLAGVAGWFALLVSQPILIGRGRFALHRRVGRASYLLAPYLAVTSLLLAHSRFDRMPPETFAAEGHSLYLPLIAVILFLASFALAIRHRRRALLHSRFMVGTAFAFFDPIVARLLYFYSPLPPGPVLYPLIGFGLADLGLLWLLLADRSSEGRKAFRILLPMFLAGHVGWFTFAQTAAWRRFSEWFTQLPLT